MIDAIRVMDHFVTQLKKLQWLVNQDPRDNKIQKENVFSDDPPFKEKCHKTPQRWDSSDEIEKGEQFVLIKSN